MAAALPIPVAPAHAVPGPAPAPAAPTTLYVEDFENGQGATPINLSAYVGAAPASLTYTAHPNWLFFCNGLIVSLMQPTSIPSGSGCADPGSWNDLRGLASALGTFAGGSPATNHALGNYSSFIDPGANLVVLQTVSPAPVAVTDRFVTFALDGAATNCQATHPRFAFAVLDGSTVIPTGATPLDICLNGVDRYTADRAVLFTGSSIGVRMTNVSGSGTGNDSAVDNIRILDATPRLDRAFAPATVAAGGVTTLTLTVVNTTELGEKQGWSLTDTLPAGLVFATPGNAGTDCAGASLTAAPGTSTLTLTGTLTAGQASCSVQVGVVATGAGAYQACAPTTLVGLDAPACATVTFNRADLAVTGAGVVGFVAWGIVLLVVGLALVRFAGTRRRRTP